MEKKPESEIFFLTRKKIKNLLTMKILLFFIFLPVLNAAGSIFPENNEFAPMDLMEQQRTITGTVTDVNGDPLPGVSVRLVGTTTGTVTNVDGRYSLSNIPAGGRLEFSFVGMTTETRPVGEQTQINVTLSEDVLGLEEVVVIGYGTQSARTITGSITSVRGESLEKAAITNFTQALQGRVPGLTAIQSTGQPGANVNLKIRSNPSFASSGILYVLDGVPVNDHAGEPGTYTAYGGTGVERSPLNFINPEDIESIEVLKDASATSIYGARAGAGVILITTKRGRTGKPTVSYTGNYSYQQPARFYDIFDSREYMTQRNRILRDMWMRNNNLAPYGTADPAAVPAFNPKFTEQEINSVTMRETAIEAISRNGLTNQHNLSIGGGDVMTKYFISANYLNQQGVIRGSDYTRYNARVNLDQVVSDNITVGVNLNISNSSANNTNVQTFGNEYSGIIRSAFYYPGNLPLVAEDGSYPLNPDYMNAPNPLSFLEVTDETFSNRLLTSGYAEWSIIPELVARANLSYDQSDSKRPLYLPKSFLHGASVGGQASIQQSENATQLMEYTLNYINYFGDHRVNVLGGYSYQQTDYEFYGMGNTNFLTDAFTYHNIGLGTAARPTVASSKSQQTWASYFTRAIYDYRGRYMLTASLRRDGSSIFARDKKFGMFPAVSAGWIISDELFFSDNVPFIDFFKFRASYGETGNSNIGANAHAYYSTGRNYVFGNASNTGVFLSQLNNDNLTWETSREINLGVDYRILGNRVSGTFDYFNRTISDLLTFRPLATSFPVSTVADNIGKTRSKGFELGIQTMNFTSANRGGFEWNTELTLSHYFDTWIERSPAALLVLAKYIDPTGPFNASYGYQTDGMYTGGPAPAHMPGIVPGTLIIKDTNGYGADGNLTGEPDGRISDADMVMLGVNDPDLTFGINNTFRYGNFDLNFYMYGYTGVQQVADHANAFAVEHQMAQFGWNLIDITRERWSYDNQTSRYPSGLSHGYMGYASNSDFWMERVDFLRMRDITLGYTLPSNVTAQRRIEGLRLYLNVQNAFIITNWPGLDPELRTNVPYPNPRSFSLGLTASF
jgi:TonB-linked SusC/RagA family outer membrane protein